MPVPPEPASAAGAPRLMRVAVAGAAALAVLAGVAFYYATGIARRPAAPNAFEIAITSRNCDPQTLTVPAGFHTFTIVNRSGRPVEWEILDGIMVVEERENISPGFRQTLSAELAPGEYAMTCGLLSNPRGTLHVTPSATVAAAAPAPALAAFIGPLAEYRFYLGRESGRLVAAAQALADAVKAGRLDEARALYGPARVPYKHTETMAYRFSDLVNRIDPVADYLQQREADPAFTGFHRIAYGLFARNSTDGLGPFVDRLVADSAGLQARLRDASFTPFDLVDGASHLARQLASGRVVSGEDAYARTDLDEIAANLESIAKISGLVLPVVQASEPAVAADVQKALAAAQDAVDGIRKDGAFPSFDTVSQPARAALAKAFGDLGDALDRLKPAVQAASA